MKDNRPDAYEQQVERYLDRRERNDRRSPFGREPAGEVHRLVGGVAGRDRHEDAPELESRRLPVLDRRAHRLAQGDVQHSPSVDGVDGEPEREPAEPGIARARILDHDDEPRQARPEEADHGEERPVDPAPVEVGPGHPRDVLARTLPPQLDHRGVRDREGEHRAERVHRAEEVRLARE